MLEWLVKSIDEKIESVKKYINVWISEVTIKEARVEEAQVPIDEQPKADDEPFTIQKVLMK